MQQEKNKIHLYKVRVSQMWEFHWKSRLSPHAFRQVSSNHEQLQNNHSMHDHRRGQEFFVVCKHPQGEVVNYSGIIIPALKAPLVPLLMRWQISSLKRIVKVRLYLNDFNPFRVFW